jgi:hypothetical protein
MTYDLARPVTTHCTYLDEPYATHDTSYMSLEHEQRSYAWTTSTRLDPRFGHRRFIRKP